MNVGVSLKLVWKVVATDVPVLRREIDKTLSESEEEAEQ